MSRLVAALDPLIRQVVALQKRARTLGIFPNDRELLTCQRCGLMENVAADGRLFTCFGSDLNRDTEMRFGDASSAGIFRCPSCGAKVTEPKGLSARP